MVLMDRRVTLESLDPMEQLDRRVRKETVVYREHRAEKEKWDPLVILVLLALKVCFTMYYTPLVATWFSLKFLAPKTFLASLWVDAVLLQTRMFCGFKGFRVLWYNFMTKTNFEIVLVLLLFILIAYAIPVYQKIHCKGLKKSMMRCICILSCLFLGQKGERGFDGVAGATGQKGERGFQGSQGQKGERGVSGSQGSLGSRGATGNTGPAGSRGATGFQGPQGSTVSSQGC